MVLGTIVLLYDSLCPESLDTLLDLEESTVRSSLHHLHSIAIVPAVGGGSVRLIHPSFHLLSVASGYCRPSRQTRANLAMHRCITDKWMINAIESQDIFRPTCNMHVDTGHLTS